MVEIIRRGQYVNEPNLLRQEFPEEAGNYLWCVQPPDGKHSRSWIPVYLGTSKDLRQRIGRGYINTDKTFGPKSELRKHLIMLELQARGFAIQIRSVPRTCIFTHRGLWIA